MSADFGNDFPCCAHQPQAPGHATDEATWKFLERVNALHPDQFKVGQEHLPPAFREIDYRLAFTTLAEMVNEFEQTFGAARAAAVAPRETKD